MQTTTLIGCAAIGFAIGSASLASSGTIQTLPAASMHNYGYEVDAGIVGGSWLSTGLATVYVDGYATSAGSMLLDLIRYSDGGTRTEKAQSTSFPAGQFEISMSGIAFANNSPWDYYTFLMMGSSTEFTSQVSLDGIGVYSH